MGDRFKKTQAGQPLDVSAEVWNSFLDSVRDRKSRKHDQLSDAIETIRNADLISVRNDSGADRDRFHLLAIDRPIIGPADNLREFKNRPSAIGKLPVHSDHFGRFAVLLDPIRVGKIGRAWVSGVCPAKVDVIDNCHDFADIKNNDASQLESQPFGSAQILWREGGIGPQWSIIRLGNINTDFRRFKLLASLNRCGSASAMTVRYNSVTQKWCDVDCGFLVYDSLGIVVTAQAGSFGWAKWLPDSQKWEVVQIGEGCCPSSGSSGSSGSSFSSSTNSGSSSAGSSSGQSSSYLSSSYSSSGSAGSSSASSFSSGSQSGSSGPSGSGGGSSGGQSCVTVYETDVRCESDRLNVYTRAVSICLANGVLSRTEGSWVFSHQAGCCGCNCGSSGSSGSGSSSWSSSLQTSSSSAESGSGSSSANDSGSAPGSGSSSSDIANSSGANSSSSGGTSSSSNSGSDSGSSSFSGSSSLPFTGM